MIYLSNIVIRSNCNIIDDTADILSVKKTNKTSNMVVDKFTDYHKEAFKENKTKYINTIIMNQLDLIDNHVYEKN